ncbi:TAXI family TRAP transporter solute-binding subunit [Halomonas campisalis]|uniref:TAXI family TRAP transporter solute-binding subunit n=1 Tax=Billgrantia campisalis TaxID=74661 RepID=A0ABS9P863_9GAMM|nr:TAXI family TRAP transporter solute-binding subunit [Halomonas campisalis]MCG6657939.1 TAXI family TRAP transporter solute-binding subunit [Halomonas campisalis]MDR5863536.1 TAXI family TRAP transporter solute-binding subunit [Halomonas campisalis]
MKRLIVTLLALALALFAHHATAQRQFLTIGTASVVGIYYPVGGATSQIINQADIGVRATVEATGGSAFNARALAAGELDMALAQSDVVFQAYEGQAGFEGEAVPQLRTMMGLHAEPLHLVCDRDAGVDSVRDIVGKRVNIGNPGSGIRFTVEQALEALDISLEDFNAHNLTAPEGVDFLRDGRVDCFFYTIGIGGAALQDISTTRDVVFVPMDEPEFEALVEEFPYFAFTEVPANTYRGQEEDITLFGVKALFVTTTDLDEEVVYGITKAILDNLEDFTKIHPALNFLTAEDFLTGLGAPLHEGAERAYQEAGLL